MQKTNQTSANYTTRQLRLPLEIEKIIDIADPVYSFCEVVDHIDLSKYFVEKGYKTGRPKCDAVRLLKVILFAFMENGSSSLRDIERLCKNDIRYMYLLDGMKAPTFVTFGNFIRDELTSNIEDIFNDINAHIFEKDHGALLCMNRSIQSEGTFGIIKWDRSYKRLFRRGEKAVILELTLISCSFNLYKYHNKKKRPALVA